MAAMSKETSDALFRIVLRRATEAMKEAVHLLDAPDEVLERELVPYWEEAIHDVWKRIGICSCPENRDGPKHDGRCFMEMTRAERLSLFRKGHPMAYDQFLEGYRMGRSMAFAELTGAAPEEDQ